MLPRVQPSYDLQKDVKMSVIITEVLVTGKFRSDDQISMAIF